MLWASAWPNVSVSTYSAAMDAQGHTHTQLCERGTDTVLERDSKREWDDDDVVDDDVE